MRDHRSTELVASGTKIVQILNVSVSDGAWTAITLGATDSCRAVEAGLRSGGSWKLAFESTGAKYRTVTRDINIDVIKSAEDTLFYVQTTSGNDTLECTLLD